MLADRRRDSISTIEIKEMKKSGALMISIGTDETSRRSLGSDMVTSDLISITISNSKNTNRSSTNREESSSSADKTLEKGRGESKVTLLSKQQSLCSLPPKTL
jgi:hypothetical protein